jgi:hypothetical protein
MLLSPGIFSNNDNPFIWPNNGTTSTTSLNIGPSITSQKVVKGKNRSSSNAAPYRQSPNPPITNIPNPSKRRKSEPQHEEYHLPHPNNPSMIGLGVSITPGQGLPFLPQTATAEGSSVITISSGKERPVMRRTTSAPIGKVEEEESPTPPPVHAALAQVLALPQSSVFPPPPEASTPTVPQATPQPTSHPPVSSTSETDATSFARLMLQAIQHPVNSRIVGVMQGKLGVNMDSLHDFALEWYERSRVMTGMEDVHMSRDVTSAESSVCLPILTDIS